MSAVESTSNTPGEEADPRRVALLTLGCARNEVDSEELAARLAADGWQVTTDGTDHADVIVVNTCGFIAKAKQESIDTLLAAADTGAKVVATGCLAERYGRELAESLPEASGVLGFDEYQRISQRLEAVRSGVTVESHQPRDRRTLLPAAPSRRPGPPAPTPRHLRPVLRRRLASGPVAPLKLASGCDRRCAFCAIPTFRGAFVSRTPDEILAEAEWLASAGVRELVLVSENSTSYGKDLGDPRLLEPLLAELSAIGGIARVRVSYLQPAETRPTLVEAIATTPGVAGYFDLSFQHASEPVLRRMRRFGSTERFLELIATVREFDPLAGIRTNVIVGFPGETRQDLAELERFLVDARLDAVGVFDYSDEDGTEAATLPGKISSTAIARRYSRFSQLAEELAAQRAADRVGSTVEVLLGELAGEDEDGEGRVAEGWADHQAPEVDGVTVVVAGPEATGRAVDSRSLRVGDLVRCEVVDNRGVDLIAVPIEVVSTAAGSPLRADPGQQ